MLLEPDDRSLQVHACHGRARQVEVLRDAILHLLADDPTLEPRDIIVMCPDIETFAPLIQATFGTGAERRLNEDEALPAERDADRPARAARRPLAAPDQPGARRRRPAARPRRRPADRLPGARPGRPRAGPPALPARRRRPRRGSRSWARDGGVRWGLDAAHRASYRLDRLPANTWQAGWDRVLVGVAMTEEEQRLFGGVLPLDDVDSGDIDLAGRFAEFLDRLHAIVDAFAEPMPLDAWAAAIADAADA